MMLAFCSAMTVESRTSARDDRQMNAQADQAAVFHQAALDDPGEQGNVDIAAADQNAQFFSAMRNFFVQRGSGGGGARAFGEIFSFSRSKRMALAISSSSTVTMSSTYFCTRET